MVLFEPSKIPGLPENPASLPMEEKRKIGAKLFRYGVRAKLIAELLGVGLMSVYRWAEKGQAE